jgi:hypothetical protein
MIPIATKCSFLARTSLGNRMKIGFYRKHILLSAWFFGAACAPENSGGTRQSDVRDSAGAEIVENTHHGWEQQRPWNVSGPVLSIGEVDGSAETQFFNVTGAVLQHGKIFVANAGTHELRHFNLRGEYEGSIGRQGEGPGEFASMGNLRRYRNDSLLVADNRGSRFSVFSPDGQFVRTGAIRQNEIALPFAILKGSTADGRLLVQTFDPTGGAMAQTPGIVNTMSELFSFDPDGANAISIGEFAGFQMFRGDTPLEFAPAPFGTSSYHAGFGNKIFVGENSGYEIRTFDTSGVLQRIIRKTHTPELINAEHRSQFLETLRGDLENMPPTIRSAQEAVLEEIPFPESFPAFKGLRLDSDGNLWVRDYPLPGTAASSYMVFDGKGHLLGPVHLPHSFTPFDIGNDYILGRYKDPDDVEYIHLYELRK